MDVESIRNYCLGKKGVDEAFPFDDSTLVFKVMGKMFALVDLDSGSSINLKCEPEEAVQLREHYPEVKPGYHMNKDHWNTVYLNGSLDENLIVQWIDKSYDLVAAKLPGKLRDELETL